MKMLLLLLIAFILGILMGMYLSNVLSLGQGKEKYMWSLRLEYLKKGFCPLCLQGQGRNSVSGVEIENKYR